MTDVQELRQGMGNETSDWPMRSYGSPTLHSLKGRGSMAPRALAAKKSEKKRYRFSGAPEAVQHDPAMMDRGVWQLQQLPACPYYRVQ